MVVAPIVPSRRQCRCCCCSIGWPTIHSLPSTCARGWPRPVFLASSRIMPCRSLTPPACRTGVNHTAAIDRRHWWIVSDTFIASPHRRTAIVAHISPVVMMVVIQICRRIIRFNRFNWIGILVLDIIIGIIGRITGVVVVQIDGIVNIVKCCVANGWRYRTARVVRTVRGRNVVRDTMHTIVINIATALVTMGVMMGVMIVSYISVTDVGGTVIAFGSEIVDNFL